MGLRWGAIVLAAGSGSRMGTRPKCLLQLQGQPLIQRHLHTLSEVNVAHTLVVLGHHAQAIRQVVGDAYCVVNPAADEGQNGSLHLGLEALPSSSQAVMVMLADQPLIDAKSLKDLIEAFEARADQTEVLVPWHADKQVPGNPVAFTASVRDDILKAPSQWGCKQWQKANPTHVQQWATNNPAYFTDLDTPQDILAFEESTGLTLRWPAELD